MSTVPPRDALLKIAKWLVARERRDEAVSMLCAVAASSQGEDAQALLGAALETSPQSPIAKAAFERMDGSTGAENSDQAGLDAAIKQFDASAIDKLHKEMNRPQFMRAQVGFNNNVKYKDVTFHVQTEDSGLKMPHIITHCFAGGGRIIKSHKRSYADEVDRADVGPYVRALMKAQHMEMVALLRSGKLDEVVAGRARGGMDVLTEPPQTDVQQIATRKKAATIPPPVPAPAAEPARKSAPVRFRLRVMRSTYGGPELYEPPGDEVVVGATGGVPLSGEPFCHPSEGIFHYRNGELFLEDLEGGNGIFIRLRHPVELEPGDELVIGDQLLRLELNPERNLQPDPGPTYLWFSPCPPQSSFRIVQILRGGAEGETRMATGTTLQLGRREGDLIFPTDPRVADKHAMIEEQAGVVVLTDLMSKTGTFVRIRGEQRLFAGDELLIGRTVLRVELADQ